MENNITIENMRFSNSEAIDDNSFASGEHQQMLDATITVRNQSATQDYYLVSDLREINYNPVSQTLLLGLIDEPGDQIDLKHLLVPSVVTLAAGAVATLRIAIPMILHRPKLPMSVPYEEEAIDVSQVKHVECRIAFHDVPPLTEQPDSGKVEINYSLPWGQFVEATFDIGL